MNGEIGGHFPYSFFDLPIADRMATYEKAERETGMQFFDLPPEERARYYERAAEAAASKQVNYDN